MKKIFASKFGWLALLLFLFIVNFVAASFHYRFDLTKEKRYTLSKATKHLLSNLDDEVRIDVFFKGSYPAGFKKIVNSVQEFLDEAKEYAQGKMSVTFSDPLKDINDSTAAHFKDSMEYFYGLSPYKLEAPSKVGDELNVKYVFPGAVIHYKDSTIGVNLLKGIKNYGTDQEQLAALYNDIEATLEYKFANAIQKITSTKKPIVAYALGNGEAWGFNINDAFLTLRENYFTDTIDIKKVPYIPSAIDALVILKPSIKFTDQDKLKIDQYIMRGGKVFWMIDIMTGDFDSLQHSKDGFIAMDRDLGVDDILFRYGVRLNVNLLQDMQCDKLGLMNNDPNNPQMRLVDWPFFPILNGTNNPISKNLDGVRAIFPNTLDTVGADGIKKTFLLRSSANARVMEAPAKVNFDYLQIAPDIKDFTVRDTSVAALLEGKFRSLFAGRMPQSFIDSMTSYGIPVKTTCDTDTKMIVVADGDIATNMVSQQYGPMPMGFNFYTKYTFANKEFFLNSIEYLVNPSGILETRSKEFTLRLLDPVKVQDQKATWRFINIGLPVLLVIFAGFIYQQVRKKKYS